MPLEGQGLQASGDQNSHLCLCVCLSVYASFSVGLW